MKIDCDETKLGGPYEEAHVCGKFPVGKGKSGKIYPSKAMLLKFLRQLPEDVQGEASIYSVGGSMGRTKIVLEITYDDLAADVVGG